jgi:hypothetical protein
MPDQKVCRERKLSVFQAPSDKVFVLLSRRFQIVGCCNNYYSLFFVNEVHTLNVAGFGVDFNSEDIDVLLSDGGSRRGELP